MLGKIVAFCKTYRVELIIEVLIFCVLLFLSWIKLLNFRIALSDGTFIAAALSVPIVVIQYMRTAKGAKTDFYTESLGQMKDLIKTSKDGERDNTEIRISIMQLSNIYESGKENIDKTQQNEFTKATIQALFKIISHDLNVNGDSQRLYTVLKEIEANVNNNRLLKKLVGRGEDNYQHTVSESMAETIEQLSWKQNIDMSEISENDDTNEIGRNDDTTEIYESGMVFYKPIFSGLDDVNRLIGTVVIDPTFDFNSTESGSNVVKGLTDAEGLKETLTLIGSPEYSIKGKRTDTEEFLHNALSSKVTISAKVDSIEFSDDISRSLIRNDYSDNGNKLVKFSRNYYDGKDEKWNSWFNFTRVTWDNFLKTSKKSILFIIEGSKDRNSLIIEFSTDEISKLVSEKNRIENDYESARIDFYLNVTMKDDEYELVDDRVSINNKKAPGITIKVI